MIWINPKLREILVACSQCKFMDTPDVLCGHLVEAHSYTLNDAYTEIEAWQQTAFKWEGDTPYVECFKHGDYPAGSICYPCDHD